MSSEGTNKLTQVLQRRMRDINDKPPILDFGTIQTDRSLLTNNFPVPIPFGDYVSCIAIPETMAAPARVLVSWVGDDATVINRLSTQGTPAETPPSALVDGVKASAVEQNGKIWVSLRDTAEILGGEIYRRRKTSGGYVFGADFKYIDEYNRTQTMSFDYNGVRNPLDMEIMSTELAVDRIIADRDLYLALESRSDGKGWLSSAGRFADFYFETGFLRELLGGIGVGVEISVNLYIQSIVWNFFINKGFSAIQTAGIMGNIRQESSWNPLARGVGRSYWGLFQLNRSLAVDLHEKYKEAGLNMAVYGYDAATHQSIGGHENISFEDLSKILDIQLKFIYNCKPTGRDWVSELSNAVAIGEAAEVFLVRFLGAVNNSANPRTGDKLLYYLPGSYYQEADKRREYASRYYETFNS